MHKGIFHQELPKKNGERKTRMTLGVVDDEGSVTSLNIKAFLAHPAPYKANSHSELNFIQGLLRALPFGQQVDLNLKFKREGIQEFIQKLPHIKAKYNARQGIVY